MQSNVVVSVSKIEISKAIHNKVRNKVYAEAVVVSVSKIEISKAIHNTSMSALKTSAVVVSLSKIEITQIVNSKIKRSRSRASTSYSTGIIYCTPRDTRWECGITAPSVFALSESSCPL